MLFRGGKIALIAGGLGAERDVSLVTGKGFAQALTELQWDFEQIDAKEDLPVHLAKLKPSVALLALHGKYGEDGTVQGICEYLRIPYTGSGVMASAIALNKYYTKQILSFHRIPTPEFQFVNTKTQSLTEVKWHQAFPVVVKPSREGSTVGLSICPSAAQLPAALKLASEYDKEILLETFIEGMELTIPVLQNRALTPIEIVPKGGFYDYQRKYTAGQTEYILPPRLSPAVIKACQDLAVQTHLVCQARTYSRVDFRVTQNGQPYVLEINTLPGCTPTSLLPKSAAYDGISFIKLIQILLDEATLDYAGVR